MKTILVVEDDPAVRQGIVDILQLRGWEIEIAETYAEAAQKIRRAEYTLYILDVRLPDGNGVALCREIRRRTERPVLFLSAYDSEEYIVEGFETGANDYVIKPFRTFELVARIRALLRHYGQGTEERIRVGVRSGEFLLDLQRQSVRKGKETIDLTLTEYRILHCLITNAPRLTERAQLLTLVWDANENYVDDNTLSVYVTRIRKKLADGGTEAPIETRRGLGYRWTGETEDVYETASDKTVR